VSECSHVDQLFVDDVLRAFPALLCCAYVVMCCVAAREDIVGFYSTSPKVKSNDLKVILIP
jgi:hypothetical protein